MEYKFKKVKEHGYVILEDGHIMLPDDVVRCFERLNFLKKERVGNVAKPNACPQLYDAEATREKLASYAHKQWSGWMEYLFSKCKIPIHHTQAGLIIPPWAVERWKRQIETPYEELSEQEKESDRKEADGMLEIICRSFI